jgi:hypothetical protein
MKYCEDHRILSMAYLEPTMVIEAMVKKKPKEMEDYIVIFSWIIRTSDTYSYLTSSSIYLTTQ